MPSHTLVYYCSQVKLWAEEQLYTYIPHIFKDCVVVPFYTLYHRLIKFNRGFLRHHFFGTSQNGTQAEVLSPLIKIIFSRFCHGKFGV